MNGHDGNAFGAPSRVSHGVEVLNSASVRVSITTKERVIAGFAPLKLFAITTKERVIAGFAPLNIFAVMAG